MSNKSSFNTSCIKCSEVCSNKEYLTCTECEKQIHYFCSDLPIYYIIVLKNIIPNYYCFKCIENLSKDKDYAKQYNALKNEFEKKKQMKELENIDNYIEKLQIENNGIPVNVKNYKRELAIKFANVKKEKPAKRKRKEKCLPSKEEKLSENNENNENLMEMNGNKKNLSETVIAENHPVSTALDNAYDGDDTQYAELAELDENDTDMRNESKSKICISHLAVTVSEDDTIQETQKLIKLKKLDKKNTKEGSIGIRRSRRKIKKVKLKKEKNAFLTEFECLEAPECTFSTSSRSLFLKHKKEAHKRKTLWKCKVCEYTCKKYSHITRHIATHSKYKPFKCEVCSFSAVSEMYLKRHVRLHSEKPFSCEKCKYRTNENSLLEAHAKKCRGKLKELGQLVIYYCDKCDYRTKTKKRLAVHELNHTGVRPFKCTLCPYGAKEKSEFNRHMKTHLKNRPHKCTYCNHSTVEKSAMVLHLRTHTKEKPFKCRYCEHCSTNKTLLKHHEFTHTGQNPFSCNYCTYACKDRGTLIVHVRKHTGEKPYKCTLCDYAAAKKTNLKIHMGSHSSEKPFKCEQCDYTTSYKSSLSSHTKSHYNANSKQFGITEPLRKRRNVTPKISSKNVSNSSSNSEISRGHHSNNAQITANMIPHFVNPTIDPSQLSAYHNLSKDIPPYSLLLNQAVLRSNLDVQNSAYNIPPESTFNFVNHNSQANSPIQKNIYPIPTNASIHNKNIYPISTNASIQNKNIYSISTNAPMQNKSIYPISTNAPMQNKSIYPISTNASLQSKNAPAQNKNSYSISTSASGQNKNIYPISAESNIVAQYHPESYFSM